MYIFDFIMDINSILRKSSKELTKAGVATASLDARVLLEDVIKKDSSAIFSHPEMPLTNSQYSRYRSLIRRRKAGEPVAYLVGHKEFYGYDFYLNKNVLIPRPETELVVENALHFLEYRIKNGELSNKSELNIIDIGTGSGCIIISLSKEIPKLEIENWKLKIKLCASDVSRKALYVARKNAKLHQVNKDIKFYNSDLFSNKQMPKKYDIIIANLPYVPTSYKPQAKSLSYEPKEAIFAGDNGTHIIKIFLDQAKDRINKDGLILIEVDHRNAKELYNWTKKIYPKAKIELLKDLAVLDRVIRILI